MGDHGSSVAELVPRSEGSDDAGGGSVAGLQPRLSPRRPPIHASPRSLPQAHLHSELHEVPQQRGNCIRKILIVSFFLFFIFGFGRK